MCSARAILAPLHNTDVKVICRCDAAAPHTAKTTQEKLKKFGVLLEIYQSSTISKNIIPEHDARIGIFSKYLNVALNNPNMHVDQAVLWATIQYNQSLTNLNWSPAEILTKRRLGDQSEIALSNLELKSRIDKCRQKSRETHDREKLRKKKKKLLQFKPWDDLYLNAPEILEEVRKNYEILKISDVIKLNIKYEKNDNNRLYVVKSIDWDNAKFSAQKLNKPKGKIFNFALSAIDTLVSDHIRSVGEQCTKKQKILKFFALADLGYDLYETDHNNDLHTSKKVLLDSGIATPGPFSPIFENQTQDNFKPNLSPIKESDFIPTTASTPLVNPDYVEDSYISAESSEESSFHSLNESDLSQNSTIIPGSPEPSADITEISYNPACESNSKVENVLTNNLLKTGNLSKTNDSTEGPNLSLPRRSVRLQDSHLIEDKFFEKMCK